MNLFVESLANYLKAEWDRVLSASDGTREARFITQSLDPSSTFELFSALEAHRIAWLQKNKLECHFRVATGLWREWCRDRRKEQLTREMEQRGGVGPAGELKWIDEEDRLTWYRNRTRQPDVDGLVIVLVGLNHASDQGGLADFHLVDEQRMWQTLEQSFVPWIERINERLGLSATDSEIERFDDVIHQLFQVRPRRLAKLAEFLELKVIAGGSDLYSLSEVIDRFYAKLPFWDIPPLVPTANGKKGGTLLKELKEADTFISHQRFKSASEQRKVWTKLESAFEEQTLELPEPLDGQKLYENHNAFRETLRAFIFEADAKAKERLLQTNLLPVLEALKRKSSTPKSPRDKIQRLSGLSLEVMLQAIWKTLVEFQDQCGGRPLVDVLAQVRVVANRFNHDLEADVDAGIGGEGLARELLQGCLGGLPEWFDEIDCRLPVDSDQARLLREQWGQAIPLTLDLEQVTFGTSRARPHLQFQVVIEPTDEAKELKRSFQWSFGPTHPERVRFLCARTVLERWTQVQDEPLLPAFQLPAVAMSALYFAADEDEANRLVSQALTEMRLVNLLEGLSPAMVEPLLWEQVGRLIQAYRTWLQCYIDEGYYQAIRSHFLPVLRGYITLAEKVLDLKLIGGPELLRRFYKAFLLVDEKMMPNDGYLHSAIAWGVSPPVLELTHARARFLCDSFPEIVAELALGRDGEAAFARLLNLVEIHRPLAGLVIDQQRRLSAEIKSFGLLHHLGVEPSTGKSLAVQTLLREEESDDDESVADIVRPREESEVVERVLNDYLQLYPFAEDGLRILAVHVEELATILSGVDRFLRNYLKRPSGDWPPFHCEVMVYSTSSSPLTMENRLATWRDHMIEAYRERGRALVLSVGHRFAPSREKMVALLKEERRLYDVAFLFRFLVGELTGETEPALPFEFDYNPNNISQFPICEYPRPIQQGDAFRRQSLLSNRRLRIQTRHADLSARLRHPQNPDNEHLIFGHINYQPWLGVVEALHGKAQWVACIDPFVDKRLLGNGDTNRRKIVGFTSGLGAYGELNLSISTEQDTLSQLTRLVQQQLSELLPFHGGEGLEAMAAKVVNEAEEIIGLSSLRAVVGQGEKIREVVGFAAIRRALDTPVQAQMSQLLPVDSLLHWFAGSEVTHRPDLLQLSLILREGDLPLIQARVIECKFAQHNTAHLLKASDQVQQGLSHFTQLFAPNRSDIHRVSFDRRYWWAQLQRAITSRSVVAMSEQDRLKLDRALESLAEGYYEISWQGAIFTFWTNEAGAEPVLTPLPLPAGVITPPVQAPDRFSIWHVALGYEGVTALFADGQRPEALVLDELAIRVRPETAAVIEPPALVDPLIPPVKPPTPPVPPVKPPIVDPPPILPPIIQVPEQLLIGTRSNGDPVYWHYGHPQLPNRHLLIFGASGSGKTYGIQCLLAEMAQQSLHSLIIDYTDGFLPQQVEPRFREVTNPQNHFVFTDRLPLNPFRRQQQIIDPSRPPFEESPYHVATRVASIFTSVFETMGDQQSSALVRVLEAGIEEDPQFTLDKMLPRLREDSQYGESLANKLEPLIKSQPFREGVNSAWEEMLTSPDHLVQVLQLKGLAREIQKMVTEFTLWDLYDYACNTGSKNHPIPVVLDEIQNLDHRSDSPIDKMLREGRKFGLSLILATQTTSQFNQEQRDRLFQAGHKLFFKPADTEIDRFAQLLSQSTGMTKGEWSQRLANLEKGKCWSLGPVLTSSGALQEKAVLVSVTSLEQRDWGS